MHVSALVVARLILVVALFPALAGCATGDEPLARGVVADAPPPRPVVVDWASPEEAEVRPGSMLMTEAGDCPVHFLFYREDNGAVFLGTTAYCVRELGIGSVATLGNGTHLAMLAYSSFITMAELGEDDPDALEYNDLAVFHLDTLSRRYANPRIPGGGPYALADTSEIGIGDRLRAFARAEDLPRETDQRDLVVGGQASDWALLTYSALPGAPGSLGGPVVDLEGNAVGVLATLGVFPNPGANGVARLDTMMAYALANAKLEMTLATWDDAQTATP